MTEAIEELERFKLEMIEQLQELIFDQAKVMLSTMKSLFSQFQIVEAGQYEEFKSLLEKPSMFNQ